MIIWVSAFDIIDESSHLDFVILNPFGNLLHLVPDLFEKQYLIGAVDNQDLTIDKLHLAEVELSDTLKPIILKIFRVDAKSLTLSIETVNPVFQVIEKAPHGKVLDVALKLPLDWSVRHPCTLVIKIGRTNHLLQLNVPNKVVVGHRVIMVEIHENLLLLCETAGDKGV